MQEPTLIPVKYIGPRPTYLEGTYGTRIFWTKGETQMVPADKAKLLLRHPDVYVPGAKGKHTVADVEQDKAPEKQDDQEIRDSLVTMDKAGLEQFARVNFQVELDRRRSVDSLRSQVIGLIDQYGVP